MGALDEFAATYSNADYDAAQRLTMEDVKKLASKLTVGSTGAGKPKGLFERMMNRLGWYRSSEWYLIDSTRLNLFKYWNEPKKPAKCDKK